jgi:hypothetical protein
MLRTTSPNISVITNFGCRSNCWYCIWKGHKLEHCNDNTNWDRLDLFLRSHQDKGKVSVSGGGDCLYEYDRHYDWWEKFFNLTNKYNLLVDVHTREKFHDSSFWNKINRCVFSSDKLEDDKHYLQWLKNRVKLRITHLITSDSTNKLIEDYLSFQYFYDCQFTIKQLVGYDDKGRYDEIRQRYPDIYYLDEGDYNIYYMPDNSIRTSFL